MPRNNHPRRGSIITVDPIRDVEVIKRIKSSLHGRNLVLFTLGINNGLRAGDLLRLRVKDISGYGIGEKIRIREEKTGKVNILMLNSEVYSVLTNYLKEEKLDSNDYLFKSRKGDVLTVASVNHLVKKWCSGLVGNYGSHSLRKTFGWVQRVVHGVSWEILCKRFNHSHPGITMRYLGFTDDEVCSILMNAV